MANNDLLKMLGIKPSARPAPVEELIDNQETERADLEPANLSDEALQLDEWDIARGVKVHASHTFCCEYTSVAEVSDFHAAAFLSDPQLTEGCVDRRRHEFIKQLLETPEYKSLHVSTQLQEYPSELAA